MFRKELLFIYTVCVLVFVAVGGISAWLTHVLAQDSRMLVADTLPGLVNAGEAIGLMDQKWNRITTLPFLPTATERSNAIVELRALRVADYWTRYQDSIFLERDRRLFAAVQTSRTNYHACAERFYALIMQERLNEASQYLHDTFKPVFDNYRSKANELFLLNKEMGEQRSKRIMTMSHYLPVLAGLTSILIFAAGFIFGIRGAFTGLEYIFKRRSG